MPRNSRDRDIYPISLRELEVVRAFDLTPGMRRVVFTGADLAENVRDGVASPQLHSDGFDDDIRMIFPDPCTGERPYPAPLGDGRLEWTSEVNGLFRTYTVRNYDEDAAELTVDFARHGVGLADAWSNAATAGDKVWIAGPKSCAMVPSHTDWLFLAGDETALPAIARCLEELPEGHRTRAIIEVPTRADIQDIDTVADAEITWEIRDEGGDFAAAAAEFSWWPGSTYVWFAGEAGRLKPLRRLVKEHEVPRENVEITGYWRATEVVKADDGSVDIAATGARPFQVIHELTELAPAFALRAAAQLDIFRHIATGASTTEALAQHCGLHQGRLERLLRFLAALGIVELSTPPGQGLADAPQSVSLSALGRELADPDSMTAAMLQGPSAQRALAWINLLDSVREGTPAALGTDALTWPERVAQDASLQASLHEADVSSAQWRAPALPPALIELTGAPLARTIALTGNGSGVYADEILRQRGQEDSQVILVGDAQSTARELAEISSTRPGSATNAAVAPGADIVIAVDPWLAADNDAVAGLLKDFGATTIALVTTLSAEAGGDEHDYEEDLERLVLTGGSVPTRRDVAQVAATAGFIVADAGAVGWGSHVIVLQRTEKKDTHHAQGQRPLV